MKKLTYGAIIACALVFFLGSCDKDEIQPGSRIQIPVAVPEIPSLSINAVNVELTMNAYSRLSESTLFTISIDGQTREQFYVQPTAKKKWQLDNLKPGTHSLRINVSYLPDADDANNLCFFHFNVFDGIKTQSITSRKLDNRNYGFDIVVEN